MLSNEIGRLRFIGIFEGISFLLLLGIAMPLKYMWDMPMAVRIVGMAHGVFFILYCLALVQAWPISKWPFKRVAIIFIAAFFPFGPFLIERSLRRDEKGLLNNSPSP
jgi:integral membrane protein